MKSIKLCRELPETANRLQSGKLSLSAASQLQVFFEKQDKKIKEEEKAELAVTFAPKLRQINQYSKEKPTFAPKLRQQIKKISPSIPSHLRKYIWERDAGQCTYVHHETKRRCASRTCCK